MPSIECLTPWSGQYFHGFCNVQPWDRAGERFICHRVPFIDRMPGAADQAELGLIDLPSNSFTPLAMDAAWNFQLGSLAQWVAGDDGEWLIYNSRAGNGFATVMLDPASGRRRVLPAPFFAVNPAGTLAVGHDFARVWPIRPGYAYPGVPYDLAGRQAPDDEGIKLLDLRAGTAKLIISYAELAARFRIPEMAGATVILSRHLFNADGSRFVFSFRFCPPGSKNWFTTLVAAGPDGSDIRQVCDYPDNPAHFDWCGNDHLLVWLKPAAAAPGFYLVNVHSRERRPVGEGVLKCDGHISYSPDRRRLVSDTFPDRERLQELFIFDPESNRKTTLGRFLMPLEFGWQNLGGDLRCDLHPCWNRRGDKIAFDSLHEDRRAVYVAHL